MRELRGFTEEKFWAVSERNDVTGCWIWRGRKSTTGYGLCVVNKKVERAHRVAYRLTRGDLDQHLCVCHRCDVKLCVNPMHLFAGTHQDNMRDAIKKGIIPCHGRDGRSKKYERVAQPRKPIPQKLGPPRMTKGRAKLQPHEVLEIRAACSVHGHNKCHIAKRYGVSRSRIYDILNGVTYRLVP